MTGTAIDVAILGGGPAGTACALTLGQRRDVSVTVIEQSAYRDHRPGEGLSPGTRPLLEYLGVWDRFAREQPLRTHATRAAWEHPEPHVLDFMFTVHGSGWCLDRLLFDRMLAAAVADCGATLLAETRVGALHRAAGRWQLTLVGDEGRTSALAARHLVLASGRSSQLTSALDAHRVNHDRLVGIGGVLEGVIDRDQAIEVEACGLGWWYTSPLPSGDLVVMLMTDSDLARQAGVTDPERWCDELEATSLVRRRVGNIAHPADFRTRSCSSGRLVPAGGTDWIAVGDAASSHDPLSSTGIAHALSSGINAAIVVADALDNRGGMLLEPYLEAGDQDFVHYLATRRRYYETARRFGEQPFWQRRQASIGIDAHQRIVDVAISETPARSLHLPRRLQRSLADHCAVGVQAHEVVARFRQLHPDVPDQLAILGLQELVDANQVRLSSASGNVG